MVGATIVEFCKELLDGDRLIVKTALYIRVALTSERLVFPFQIIIYKHIYRSNVIWYDKPVNHIIKESTWDPDIRVSRFQWDWSFTACESRGAGYLRKLIIKIFQTDLPISS